MFERVSSLEKDLAELLEEKDNLNKELSKLEGEKKGY